MRSRPEENGALSLSHCVDTVRLDLSTFQFHPAEEQMLREAWSRVLRVPEQQTITPPREVAIVVGQEGTGKATLVSSIRGQVEDEGGIFVSGKFQTGTSRSFSGIADAFTRLLDQTLDLENDSTIIHHHIVAALGEDIHSLKKVIPRLGDIYEAYEPVEGGGGGGDDISAGIVSASGTLGHYTLDREASVYGDQSTATTNPSSRYYRRLQGQFRKLLRVLARRPIVVVLEGLQNADAQSLELLEALLIDKQSRGVVFVGTSRDDDQTTWLLLRKLSGVVRRQPNELRITKITLRHMDVHALNNLLATATESTNLERTEPLAKAIFRKTQGNYFFVRQFVELIQEQNLLLYSLRTNRWEWDVARIEAETDISENVVGTVVERMHLLPPLAQETLKIAACLGMQFDPEMVNLIVSNEVFSKSTPVSKTRRILGKSGEKESVVKVIEPSSGARKASNLQFPVLFKTRLVEMAAEGYVKFSHERVKQAAYSLINEKGRDRDQLHLRIGRFMFDLYSQAKYHEDWVFFSAIDQLNEGSSGIYHIEDKFELASMNMTAGEIARGQSAFVLAASYLAGGVKILEGTPHWRKEYAFSIDLFSSAAEMEHCAGNVENCKNMVDAVLANARCLEDKLRAYFALVNLLGTQGQLDAAITLGLNVVRDLGEPFPERPRKMHIAAAMGKTKRMLRGKTNEELCLMPRLKKPNKLVTLRMLTRVATNLFMCQKSVILPMVLLRFMQISLKCGMSEYAPFAFATYALVLVSDGAIDEGYRFAELAMRVVDRASPAVKTDVVCLVHMFLYHWKNPLRHSLEPLMETYNLGMECGNIEMGMLCAGVYCLMYTFSGLPLKHVAADMKNFAQQMLEYRQETVYTTISPIWQYIMNLTGDPEDPLQLTGEAMEQDELYLRAIQTRNTATVRNVLRYRLMLALLFGDLQLAESMHVEIEKQEDEIQAHFAIAREKFAAGITYAGLGRSLNLAPYKRKARRQLKTMEKWIKNGNVNCHDMLLLMRAEIASMNRSSEPREVKALYDQAISSSSRSGYIHNAALACEKVAEFFRTRNDYYWAEEYLNKSHDYYSQWNAWSKVRMLERSHPSLGTKSGDAGSVRSGSLQGRTRFKRTTSMKHTAIKFRRRVSDPTGVKAIRDKPFSSASSYH